MADSIRTLVTFRSSIFNTTQTKPNYINPYSYGDDVAEWLRVRLKNAGIAVEDNISQEDFGWYFGFQLGEHFYQFVLSYNADGYWLGWLERKRGFVGSLFRMRSKGIGADAVTVIQAALLSSEEIRDVRWHYQEDFDAQHEGWGSATPI